MNENVEFLTFFHLVAPSSVNSWDTVYLRTRSFALIFIQPEEIFPLSTTIS